MGQNGNQNGLGWAKKGQHCNLRRPLILTYAVLRGVHRRTLELTPGIPKQGGGDRQITYYRRRFPSCCSSCIVFSKVIGGAAASVSVRPTRNLDMADDEPVDPKKYLEEGCKPKCVKPLLDYQACVKRIEGDDSGHKHCTGQYFDYWSCVDKCVAPKLFSKVK
ncbi:hypothetical protein MLD38_023196 [Melastoma candidum]|uniref:Uncharacterized protein n=1 Tax=Melastoma candidum TaxID=119954 RepID=A0ACB9QQ80_9MYRT|nr:hypothetical protein MLD38_023196 [Melastoma candidum]